MATVRETGKPAALTLTGELGTVTGSFGPDRTLARDVDIAAGPELAGNLRGDIAAVWSQAVRGHTHLKLSLRHPGSRFGRAHVLRGDGRHTSVAVAYGERGDTLVAYQREFRTRNGRRAFAIEVRMRRAHHGFGSPQRLATSRGAAWIAVALAPTGRAYVCWAEQDRGEEANQPLVIAATVAAPNHLRFNRALVLAASSVRARPQGAPRLGVDREGNATLAWSMPIDSTNASVDVATARARRRFGSPVTVAASGILQDLAVRSDGTSTLVWTEAFGGTFSPRRVLGAYRAEDARRFGAVEDIAPAPEDPGAAAVAFDAVGRPVVAWIGRPGYDGAFPPQQRRAVRLAVRNP